MSEHSASWADTMAQFLASLTPDEQDERLIDAMLICPPTAALSQAFNDAQEHLEALSRQQAPQATLVSAEAIAQHWYGQIQTGQERDRRVTERQTLGPEYSECACLGRGGWGNRVGLVILGTAGEPLSARIDGVPQWTRERICPCPDGQVCKAQVERWRVTASDQLRARRVARIAGAAEIPASARGLTVDTWSTAALAVGATPAAVRRTLALLEQWERGLADERGPRLLLLAGNQGVGKSGLAAAIAQGWVDQERSVLYRSVERLAVELRAAPWRARQEPDALPTEVQLLQALGDAELLVLDDLGVEAMTVGNEQILRALLSGILDRRMTTGRATLVTTNLDADEILARYGARIHDRLIAPAVAVAVEVAVPNLRWPTA